MRPTAHLNPPAPASGRHALRVVAGTALAYLVAGRLALLLAVPPSYASPLFPAAGVALAAVLVHGRLALPGVWLGALLVNAPLQAQRELDAVASWWTPLLIALGATLQALLGRWLMSRRRRQEALALGEPRDVVAFALLGAALACTVSASVGTVALSLAGGLAGADRFSSWWTWWLGDTLGVLIATPVVLAWIGRPRAAWAPRRLTLALPLLVATALLALAATVVARWDALRVRHVFERDAAQASAAIDTQLLAAQHTLEAMRGVFLSSESVSLLEMRRAAAPWLNMTLPVQAIGYAERVDRGQLPAFQARVRTLDGRTLRVFDRQDAAAPGARTPADADDMTVIRFVEPEDRNQAALGLNSRSIPAVRAAIERATLTDAGAATAPFVLTQVPGDESGVVVYRALYQDGTLAQPDARRAGMRGLVFVSLRMQQVVDSARRRAQPYLGWCLVDQDSGISRRRLAGAADCERAVPGGGASVPLAADRSDLLSHRRLIDFAGRRWELILQARASEVPDSGRGGAWLFSLVGLLATALFTVLLLVVTGRTRRIEAAVAERTAELEHEVLERERTEGALRESERRFRNIFDQAPLGIVYGDLDGRIREANPRLREMCGLPAERLAQRSILDLLHADHRGSAAALLGRLLRGGPAEVWPPARLSRPDGQEVWVQTQCNVLLDAVGRPARLVAVMEDITEQRRRQDAERGRALAESANRAKSEFLSRMSHELRTPLNAMLGFAQLLELDRRQPLAPHQAGWTAQILRAGWHLLEMINDTLDLSRIEAGEMRLQLVRLPLAPLVHHCIAMVETAAAQRGIRVEVALPAGLPAVLADETRLRQVLTNLLSNAVKYNVDQGQVTLGATLADEGRMLALRVCDTGLGLTEAQLAELFQPFNRLGREEGEIEGTGIGLVISRRLAELMGGSLHAEQGGAAPGGAHRSGATFVLRLPVAPLALASEGPPAAPADEEAVTGYRQRHVHYIEDNETNIEVLRGMLLQRPQVRLSVSTRGHEGLRALRADPPDLLLLDMHLPDMDGLDLLARLREDPASDRLPVVVLSADATQARVQQALALGARQYLTKPLDMLRFLAVLDEQLHAAPPRQEPGAAP